MEALNKIGVTKLFLILLVLMIVFLCQVAGVSLWGVRIADNAVSRDYNLLPVAEF
jgi:flagellar basal body-associated protein FliL